MKKSEQPWTNKRNLSLDGANVSDKDRTSAKVQYSTTECDIKNFSIMRGTRNCSR